MVEGTRVCTDSPVADTADLRVAGVVLRVLKGLRIG